MNAGAILNRINFGLVLAAGRLPGASLSHWPEAAMLRTASRDAQVDAVVSDFLGGQASPDTRDILRKGENPLVARLAGSDTVHIALPDDGAMMTGDAMPGAAARMGDAMPGAAARMNGQLRPAAARRSAGAGSPVALTGLAQVVGLAIGAPEFQRR